MFSLRYTRREVLRSTVGLAGLTIPTFLQARARAGSVGRPRAKACIVVYLWGGISHYESWDPKPNAPAEVRGEFGSISTATPGIHFCEHIPLMARHSEKLAVVRSIHHDVGGHGGALTLNLTGFKHTGGRAKDPKNRPSLMALLARHQDTRRGTPTALRLPHSMYDNGTLIPGQFAGWLGAEYDPILIPTPAGIPFGGVSRTSGSELRLKLNLKPDRVLMRRNLLARLERQIGGQIEYERFDRFRKMAADMLLGSALSEAYDLEREDPRIRGMCGNHMGGQSMLLARRLVEAGVPIVQVCAGAGDLAGGSGDNWDTHRDHFPKMKKRLLPVLDRSVSALLTDLEQRGMLEETLVVLLTDFGRTPKVNKNGGRDHYPAVYSTILAGGGIRGGQVYGSSNRSGTKPAADPCTPGDLHATVFKAMGIEHHKEIYDELGRPFQLCSGQPLPLF